MQYFKDTNGAVYAYENDVDVANKKGPAGPLPNIPDGLTAYTPPAPTASEKLTSAQAEQKAQINAAATAAENAPITFTTAAGVTATFPMTAQVKYLAAYTRYVVHSQTLPSGFAFLDENGKSIAMTVADIDSMATQVFDQVDSAVNKLGTLIAKIDAATTVSAVQAITW